VGADDWAQELRDYPTIWAIGTILGVTKEVDMKFTRAWDMPRFQVMVLDLIPQSVDVVIGISYMNYISKWRKKGSTIIQCF
jgi:hypothetical protein